MAISFNPSVTTNVQNSFLVQSNGFVQGTAQDNPASKQFLNGGQIAASVTVPMFGGMAITETVPSTNGTASGDAITIATASANVTGFSVYDQGYNGIITPGNTAPQYAAGQTLMYYRLGSMARIAVQCTSAAAAAIASGATNQALTWDYTNQRLATSGEGGAALPASILVLSTNTNSKIVAYNSGTGATTWTTGIAAIIMI